MQLRASCLHVVLVLGLLCAATADAAIAFRAASNAGVLASSSLTINKPAGTAADDVLIASIAVRPVGTSINTPSGWTRLRNTAQSSDVTMNLATFYRVASASEAASYTWTFSGSSHAGAVGGMLSISGVDTSSPIHVEGGNTTAYGFSHQANQITTTLANTLLVSVHAFTSASSGWTPPSGMTEAVDAASQSRPDIVGMSLAMNYQTQASAAATGNKNAVAASSGSDAGNGAAHLLALKPGTGATPIAEYRFDASTPTDSSGNSLNGTLNGGVTTGVTGKVCSAYTFNGSNAYISVPHNTLLNLSQISVGAWVRHTSSSFKSWETILAKGDSAFRLHTNGGCSINSPTIANALTFGIDAGCSTADVDSGEVPVTNQWYHVFGTYDGSTIKIYLNGVLKASGAYTGAINSNTFPLYIGENSEQTGRYWAGNIDEVKIFSAALTALEVAAGYANENAGKNWDGTARTCAVTPPPAPAGFNCVQVGANAGSGHLYTQLVGSSFNFDIVALKADASVETSYASDANKVVTVELVDGSGSTACASRTTRVSWPGQTLTSANAGRISASAASVASAYANLRCRVSDGSVTGCSSDNFAIRPTGFTLASSANADATGSNATAAPVVKTGTAFPLTATAVAGYDATPSLDTSKLQAHSGAVQSGTLAGGFGAANSATGVATGSGFTYSEVGYFRLAADGVIDSGFTSVDASNGDCTDDYSNTAVSGKFGCKFGNTAATGYFGRFIPDHFALTPGALSHACGSFTYFGQDFPTPFSLIAQNSANATTLNYTGNFARLGLGTWNNFGFAATGATLAQGASAPSGSWNNGLANVSATHKTARALSGTPQATADLSVTAQAVDSDGVSMSPTAVAATTAPHRFGRLRLANAYGSELLALPVSLTTQFWNGSGFVTNTLDSCTSLGAPSLTFFGQTANNQLASGETSASYNAPFAAGMGGLRLSAPGAGNFGYLDLAITAPAWLQYNWDGVDQAGDGNLFDDPPRARATFGKRKGSDKVIIRREIY